MDETTLFQIICIAKRTHAETRRYIHDPDYILFAHAFSGCDTTPFPFRHGKTKLCALLENKPASTFYEASASTVQISRAEENISWHCMAPVQSHSNHLTRQFLKMSSKKKLSFPRLYRPLMQPTTLAADFCVEYQT